MLTQRNIEILKIIVEEYLATGEVIGSKLLLKKYDLGVSSATVRNDMAKLENLELIYQPYHSAGRLPTTKGLRAFVDFLMKSTPNYFLESEAEKSKMKVENFYDLANKISFELARKTGEIAFFIIPENNLIEYNGVGSFLDLNYKRLGDSIFSIVKMLEEKENFIKFMKSQPFLTGINVFIGEENIIPFLKDYTIIVKNIKIGGKDVFLGIIGSLKMNYSFNISAVDGII
ncbi:hypothetical protein D8B46_08800 [Candidatus Gracilibacteria bacterium]|nr:MAG: hypothetical protein D8B46_08800 [Candidatus Gracilibacteria bacterium]